VGGVFFGNCLGGFCALTPLLVGTLFWLTHNRFIVCWLAPLVTGLGQGVCLVRSRFLAAIIYFLYGWCA